MLFREVSYIFMDPRFSVASLNQRSVHRSDRNITRLTSGRITAYKFDMSASDALVQ